MKFLCFVLSILSVLSTKPGVSQTKEISLHSKDTILIKSAYSNDDGVSEQKKISEFGAIVINEIMYNTDEREEEWIELYNTRENTINLKNWTIGDRRKTVTITSGDYFINSGEYVVLGSAEQKNYPYISIPSFIELNNTGDDLVLKDSSGALIDSLTYDPSWGGGRNISLERIYYENPGFEAANWQTCQDSLKSTPGSLNSCSPKQYDLRIVENSLTFDTENTEPDNPLTISVKIENFGRNPISEASLNFSFSPLYSDSQQNIETLKISELLPGEIKEFSIIWENRQPGTFYIIADIQTGLDQVPDNNILEKICSTSYPKGTLYINEIMYNPEPGNCEWIEIFNAMDANIELFSWSFSDSDADPFGLADSSCIITPGEYIIIAKDSTICETINNTSKVIINTKFPSLNNTSDVLYIYDATGKIIDKVNYDENWGGAKGKSLEKINPRISGQKANNWATCVSSAGHTAGRENSIYTKILPAATQLSITPNPFSPDGDGIEDTAAITYSLPSATAFINLKIFDINGRMVRFLANHEPSGAKGTFLWNGFNEDGQRCRIGIYIVLLEALNKQKANITVSKKTIVLALPL